LSELNITWCDWDDFKWQSLGWDWKINEKDNGKKYFNFIDKTSEHKYKGRIENIHKSLIFHTRVAFDFENYSRFNTRNLITCLETGVSNFYFRDCKAPLSDELARFLIKSRAGIQFTPKRKQDILGFGNGLCACGKAGTLKHLISCCP
jgi:SNF2 family DNA or RNA helicase